jgi:crossover junction endodeoxyribonuclease RuvC
MIILGIDPGSVRVGYGVLEKNGNEITLKDAGLLSIPQKESSGKRLVSLENDLQKIIHTWKPNRVGVEKIFFTKNKKTGISVAESRGVIMKTLSESHMDIFELSPTTIKMSITGNGKSDKKDVERMVKMILKIQTKQFIDDTIDAIAIGYVTAFLNKNLVF